MNWLDWIILFVLGLTAFSGVRQGLSAMVAMGVLAAIALLVARPLAASLQGAVAFASDDPAEQAAAVYVILAAVGVIAAVLVGAALERYLKLLPAGGWRDRIAGGVLGFVIGTVIVSAIMSGFLVVAPDALGDFVRSGAIGRFLTGPFHNLMATLWLAHP